MKFLNKQLLAQRNAKRKERNLKNKIKREAVFTTYTPWKAIFIMVTPTIISSIIFSTYQIFDKWIATQWGGSSIIDLYSIPGHIINSAEALKIINISTTYAAVPSALMQAFASFISVGTSVRFAITYGKNKLDKMSSYVGNGFVMSFMLSVIFMIVMYFLSYDIIAFQASGDANVNDDYIKHIIQTEATRFSHILILATPLLFFSNFWLVLLRSEGRVISNIIIILISCLINISLDFLFVIPARLGMEGTAYATIIAWLFNFCVAIILIYYTNSNLIINLHHLKLKRALMLGILLLGLTSLLQNATQSLLAMITVKILNSLPAPTDFHSDSPIPIYVQLYGGIMPWLILINAPFIGVSQGSRALIAFIYGKKDYRRIWQITWRLILFLFLLLCISLILVVGFGQYMMNFFGVDLAMAEHFKIFIILQFAFYPLATLHFIAIIFYQGINRAKTALFAGLQRTIFMPAICLGLGYLIAVKTNNGMYFYLLLGMIDVFAAFVLVPLLAYTFIKAKPLIYKKQNLKKSKTNVHVENKVTKNN